MVPALYRVTAHLHARWLHHRRAADVALAVTLLLVAAAALTAAHYA
jgi:hypothetical protein